MLGWLPRYSPGWLQLDLIAGVTVGITVVPQALAYAEVAGLPPQVGGQAPGAQPPGAGGCQGQPHAWGDAACAWAGGSSGRAPSTVPSTFVPTQYGLYSSFVGCFVYCFLGTAKDVTLGPTAIMSLLVSSYAFHDPVYAVLLAFLTGCIQLAMGLLHLGEMLLLLHAVMFWGYVLELFPALCSLRCWGCPANVCDSSVCVQPPRGPQQGQQRTYCPLSRAGFLLDFISCPVIKGFTSAASITISFNQVKVGAADLLHTPCMLSPGAG